MGVIDETTQDDDEEEEESEKRNRLLKRRKLRRKLRVSLVPTTAPVDLTRTRLPVTEAAVITSLMSPSRWAGLKSRRRLLGGTATARAVAKNGGRKRAGSSDEDDSDYEKPKKKKRAGGGGGKNGYTAPVKLSEELADIVGGDEMPRHEVVKRMWAYIKDNKLQDPKNKQFVKCDEKLSKVIPTKKFKGFGMTKFLKEHMNVE